MPVITIIMPVYNVAAYLSRCLNSVLNQTFTDFEVICINDGSTDDSLSILKKYALKDKRIKIITQKNFGQSVARNNGLEKATGEYIYFIDADDYIAPQTLEILLATAQKTDCAVVAMDETKKYGGDEPYNLNNLQYTVHHDALTHILNTNIASSSVIWNKLYKSDLIKNRRFINGIYFEDWPWMTCLFADLDKYASVPYALYCYNTYNQSTMRSTFTKRKICDYITGIKAVRNYFSSNNYVSLWPIVRAKRVGNSIKMMINKTYHESENQPDLDEFLLQHISELRREGILLYREQPFNVLMRLIKIFWRCKI